MQISEETLINEAAKLDFKEEMLEKVWYLMKMLDCINSHPYLKNRLVLKGGTALNLFFFKLPRLSIDIDLNYIGNLNREEMIADKPEVNRAIEAICHQEGLQLRRIPSYHAGGKFQLKYKSFRGDLGNLEIDINYMYRIPLVEPKRTQSKELGGIQTKGVLTLSIEELSAGKLTALFSRKASRDLFDTHYLLHNLELDSKKLKTMFLAYGVMSPNDLRKISLKDVDFDEDELQRKLVPVLQKNKFKNYKGMTEWAKKTSQECRDALEELLNFSKAEKAFLDVFHARGIVDLELITDDKQFIESFNKHPLLAWRKQQIAQAIV